MKEIWKDIPNYEGYYQASNTGKIRSMNYNHTKKVKVLDGGHALGGYKLNIFCVNSVRRTIKGQT